MKIALSFLVLFCLPLFGESRYEEEVVAIRLRTADLIDHGRARLDQIGNFKNSWIRVGFYTGELFEITRIHKDPREYSGDPDLQALHDLTFEKVFVDVLKQRLEVILPKVEESLYIAEGVLSQYPDLKEFQSPMKEQVLQELHQLDEVITERKNQVESQLQMWREWQMGVALQADLHYQGVIADRLSVVQDIGQVRAILHRLWLNTLQALYARDFKTGQEMLAGYSWFKSAAPLYFSDKITTRDQADFLKEILNEAGEKESEMTAQYHLLSAASSWQTFAGEDGEGSEHGDGGETPDRDDFPKDSKDVIDRASHLDPGSGREYVIERFYGDSCAVSKIEIQKDVCKYDAAGNGTAKITAEGNGFIKFDCDRNPTDKVDLPAGAELRSAIDRGVVAGSFKYEGSVPCDPQIEKNDKEYKEKWDHLDKMVRDAHDQAKNEEDKKGLEDVKNALTEFQNTQNQYDQAIKNKIEWVRHAHNTAKENTNSLSKSLPAPPSFKMPTPIDPQNILGQLHKIRQSIWNNALSSGRSISHALGAFIQNLMDRAPLQFQGAARQVIRAVEGHQHPPTPHGIPKYGPMTAEIRSTILKNAKALRDGSKIFKYSKVHRHGPDSYDCSGFVGSMYASAGMSFGLPIVQGIIALANTNNGPFKEVSIEEAEPGDLVIWKKIEGKNTDDHVAIFDGEQIVKGEKGLAVISTSSSSKKTGRNAIQETLIKYMMGDKDHPIVHFFKWKIKN